MALVVRLLWSLAHNHLTPLEIVGVTVSIGAVSGAIGIVFAHELTHRMSWSERRIADALMVSVSYHNFCVEHVDGHHRAVGTKEDPATARLNESFYSPFRAQPWAALPRPGASKRRAYADANAAPFSGAIAYRLELLRRLRCMPRRA